MNEKFYSSYICLRHNILKHIHGADLAIQDVGCSTGINTQWLVDKGYVKYCLGIEIDQDMAEEAKKKILL